MFFGRFYFPIPFIYEVDRDYVLVEVYSIHELKVVRVTSEKSIKLKCGFGQGR